MFSSPRRQFVEMPSVICAASNSLPLDTSKKVDRPIPTPTPCYSVGGSKPNGLNRSQHLSERCSSAAANHSNGLSLSHPKLLRLEALNRSFHNAANLATELKESLNNGLMSNGGATSTSSLASNPPSTQKISFAPGLPPSSGSPSSTTAFVRHFSLKIKNHVQTSLSDPLKRKGSGNNRTRRILDSPLLGTNRKTFLIGNGHLK